MLHSRPSHGRARAVTFVTGYRSDAKAICVLGMHRGGTSAVTGVVHELGAFLGPAGHLMARRKDNPAGFFEHQLLTDLNDELLHALGGTWSQPPRFDDGWEHASHLDGIRVRAQQRLHEDFADAPLWVWKDPRSCLTLPFWRPLLPPTQFVVCVRNPLDVARSLLARDGLDEAMGIDLWMRHTVAALAGHGTLPLLVLYDDVVDDPSTEVARIAAFLELDASPGAVARARAHLADNAGLRHHHTTFAEVCAAPAVSCAAVALYAVLQRSVALQRSGALRLEDLLDVAGPLAGRAARARLAARDAAGWSLRLVTLDARVAVLAGALDARDGDLVRARDDVLALTSRLHEAMSGIARLDALLIDRETEAGARLSARNTEMAELLRAQEAEAGARLSARNAEVAALLLVREAEAAARLSASHAQVVVLRTAHDAEVAALRTARDAEVTELHTAHDTEVVARQAQTAADEVAKAGLHVDVQRARAELSAAGTEVSRLNALLLHLQTPTGIVKLGVRVVLPPGLHRRLRSWAEWARGGSSAP